MTVGRICSRVVETAAAHELVGDVAERMLGSNVGSLPVLDEDRRLVGIVTDRDLALRVLAGRRNPQETRIVEVMSECVQTIREDATIESALAAMRTRGTRRLPVVDAGDRLVGMLALDDVLSLLAEEFGTIGKVIDAEAPRKPALRAPPSEPPPTAPLRREATAVRPLGDLAVVERLLVEVRNSLEVIACAVSIGLETRILGGGVIEADVRAAADRRLRDILARQGAEADAG
jgi:CBS domain-containing protein